MSLQSLTIWTLSITALGIGCYFVYRSCQERRYIRVARYLMLYGGGGLFGILEGIKRSGFEVPLSWQTTLGCLKVCCMCVALIGAFWGIVKSEHQRPYGEGQDDD